MFITLTFVAPLKLIAQDFEAQEMPEFYVHFQPGNFIILRIVLLDRSSVIVLLDT